MNKRSSPDAKVKQQQTLVEFKAGCDNWRCHCSTCQSFFSPFESAIQRHLWNPIDLKRVNTTSGGRNGPYAYVEHTCNVRSHAECVRRHPISECSASIPDRRRRTGSAPGPPAQALRRLVPVLRRPAPPRSPSHPSSFHPSLHGGLTPSHWDSVAPQHGQRCAGA